MSSKPKTTIHAKAKEGPQKHMHIVVPKILYDKFKAAFPNVTAKAKLVELMTAALPNEVDFVSAEDAQHRRPTHWLEKDSLFQNAILLHFQETLASESKDPEHFDQLMQLGFATEERFQNSNEEANDGRQG